MWKQGKINGCEYWVKHFEESSIYGINDGCISKLSVRRDGREIINYDRGWDLEPQNQEDQEILEALLKRYN